MIDPAVIQRLRLHAQQPGAKIFIRPVHDEKTGLASGDIRLVACPPLPCGDKILTATRVLWDSRLKAEVQAAWMEARALARRESGS